MGQYSKRPAGRFCETTDGQTMAGFPGQYLILNRIPKAFRTDKATAFTGRSFRELCKNHHIGSYAKHHTPTELVERGLKTLKETLMTIKKRENASAKHCI